MTAYQSSWAYMFDSLIETLGVHASLYFSKKKSTIQNIQVGISTNAGADPDLVNSVGIGQRVITLRSRDVDEAPSKFDFFTINTEKLTIDTVSNVYEPKTNQVIGYKCIVRVA
jgi:hypothetical protein